MRFLLAAILLCLGAAASAPADSLRDRRLVLQGRLAEARRVLRAESERLHHLREGEWWNLIERRRRDARLRRLRKLQERVEKLEIELEKLKEEERALK